MICRVLWKLMGFGIFRVWNHRQSISTLPAESVLANSKIRMFNTFSSKRPWSVDTWRTAHLRTGSCWTFSLVAQLSLGSKQDYYEDCIECCREKMPKEPAKCHLSAYVNFSSRWFLHVFTCVHQHFQIIGILWSVSSRVVFFAKAVQSSTSPLPCGSIVPRRYAEVLHAAAD